MAHKVLQHDGLTEDGPVVNAAAPVAVPTSAHLLVEGAVHLILLRTEDLHGCMRACEVACKV